MRSMAPTPPIVRIGLVQTWADADPRDNLRRTIALVEQAASGGAKLVCLQELFLTPYFCQEEDARHFALAETIPGPTTSALGEAAQRFDVTIVASLFERRAPGLFHNTAAVIGPDGGIAGLYRKMHVPDDPRFFEKFYFTPGDLGFRATDTPAGRIGTLVCWDQWYPEAARLTALRGATVLVYPTAIGTWTGEMERAERQHDAWRTMQRSHAIANGVFVAAVNRVGREGELVFWGRSFVAAPDGRVLAEAEDREEVLVVDLDLAEIDAAREGWPFLRDRRIDAYAPITRRFLDEASDA
jgi:N-carbamoylputrescine amidase